MYTSRMVICFQSPEIYAVSFVSSNNIIHTSLLSIYSARPAIIPTCIFFWNYAVGELFSCHFLTPATYLHCIVNSFMMNGL